MDMIENNKDDWRFTKINLGTDYKWGYGQSNRTKLQEYDQELTQLTLQPVPHSQVIRYLQEFEEGQLGSVVFSAARSGKPNMGFSGGASFLMLAFSTRVV